MDSRFSAASLLPLLTAELVHVAPDTVLHLDQSVRHSLTGLIRRLGEPRFLHPLQPTLEHVPRQCRRVRPFPCLMKIMTPSKTATLAQGHFTHPNKCRTPDRNGRRERRVVKVGCEVHNPVLSDLEVRSFRATRQSRRRIYRRTASRTTPSGLTRKMGLSGSTRCKRRRSPDPFAGLDGCIMSEPRG